MPPQKYLKMGRFVIFLHSILCRGSRRVGHIAFTMQICLKYSYAYVRLQIGQRTEDSNFHACRLSH